MGWGCPYTRTSKNRRFLLIRAYAECLLCRLAFALLYTLPALQACFPRDSVSASEASARAVICDKPKYNQKNSVKFRKFRTIH